MSEPEYSKPPLSFARTIAQMAAGWLTGVAGAYVISLIVRPLLMQGGHPEGYFDLSDVVGATLVTIGYVIFSPLGVWLAGITGRQTASIWVTFAPAWAASVILIPLANLICPSPDAFLLVPGTFFLTPLIGAVTGFNLTRRWRAAGDCPLPNDPPGLRSR